MWKILDPHTTCLPSARFSGIHQLIAIGNHFGLRLSGRFIHDCMNSTFVDSFVCAETETEVESTSAISNEVRLLSQNLQKELVWPEKSFGEDIWDLVARHNPDDSFTV